MGELWDVYDINRNKTGQLHERGRPMLSGNCHLIVQVWIINNKEEFLISKCTGPDGKWQTTGGCVIAGEDSLSGALRETKEELGIELEPQNGRLFKQYSEQHTNDEGTGLYDIWVFHQEVEISKIIFQPDETCDAMWVNKVKISQMIDKGIFLGEWYPYLNEMLLKGEIING
jgi:isopentenyldiphosphate isomerase